MRVRLIRKLAARLDGIDVSRYYEGDVLELPRREAKLLIAEGWARLYRRAAAEVGGTSWAPVRALASDISRSASTLAHRLRRITDEIEHQHFAGHGGRRAEDRYRDELFDAHAKTVVSCSS